MYRGERVLERDGLEGHRSRSELKKGSRLPSAPQKRPQNGAIFVELEGTFFWNTLEAIWGITL